MVRHHVGRIAVGLHDETRAAELVSLDLDLNEDGRLLDRFQHVRRNGVIRAMGLAQGTRTAATKVKNPIRMAWCSANGLRSVDGVLARLAPPEPLGGRLTTVIVIGEMPFVKRPARAAT